MAKIYQNRGGTLTPILDTANFVDTSSNQAAIAGTKTFTGTVNVPDSAAGDNSSRAANTKFVKAALDKVSASFESTLQVSSSTAANSSVTLPGSLKYVVGSNQLTVSYNGLVLYRGFQYNENGTPGTESTSITILHDLIPGDTLVFRIAGLADNTATAANVVHTSGDQTVAGIKTFTSSPVVPNLSTSDSSTKAANTKFVHDAMAGFMTCFDEYIDVETAIAPETNITLPSGMSYVVGSHMLMVSCNGLICIPGKHFVEVGTNGTESTTIKMLFDLVPGDQLGFRLQGISDMAEIPADIAHTVGNETFQGIKTFTSSPLVPNVSSSDNSTKAANTKFVHDLVDGFMTCYDELLEINANTAAGTNITLPSGMKYVVGSHMLMVSYNSLDCYLGKHYEEVGTNGTESTTIKILFDLVPGDQLGFRIHGLSDMAEIPADVAHTVGNETFQGTKTFTDSPVVPNLSTSDNSSKAANTKFVHDMVDGFMTCYDEVLNINSAAAANSNITLPSGMQYIVGSHMLMVSYNGAVCLPGEQFEEVGTNGTASTQIKILFDLIPGDQLGFRIHGISDMAEIPATVAHTVGNETLQGVKTFTSLPVIPTTTPTQDGQAVSKKYLDDRFSDAFVNVKDFGAKGDGVTDDTAAFEAAASTGRTVFVPEGSYKVMQAVAGKFISNGDTAVPFTNVQSIAPLEINPTNLWNLPLNCGGDYPDRGSIDGNVEVGDTQGWGRATQAAMVDPFDKILYVTYVKTSGESGIEALHWSENEAERTKIAVSNWELNFLGHQGTFLYRPYKSADPLFITKGNHISLVSGVDDFEESLKIHIVRWSPNTPNQFEIVKNLEMFDSATYNQQDANGLQIACSPDGKYLVGRAKRISDSKNVYRVWDLHAIVLGVTTDLLTSYMYQFDEPDEVDGYGGQGLATDGEHIYVLSGLSNFRAAVLTMDGRHCFIAWANLEKNTPEYSDYKFIPENESLFFAPWNGKMRMFSMISHSVYNKGYDSESGTFSNYSRYNRYYCWDFGNPKIKCSSEEFYRSYITISNHDNENTNTPGLNFKRNDVALVPQTGGNFYTNIYFNDKNDDWISVIQPCRFNARSCIRLRTRTSDMSKEGEIRLDAFDNNVVACGIEGNLYPLTNNAYTLGMSNMKWSNIYASTSSIDSSDERLKTSINKPSEDLIRAWSHVDFKAFKFKSAVESKGDNARYHLGVVAQDIDSAFTAEGLNARDYGLFCYDQWDEQEEVLNEDGSVATPSRPAGDSYSVRYVECLILECAYQRHRADKAESRIADLESRLTSLESKLGLR